MSNFNEWSDSETGYVIRKLSVCLFRKKTIRVVKWLINGQKVVLSGQKSSGLFFSKIIWPEILRKSLEFSA